MVVATALGQEYHRRPGHLLGDFVTVPNYLNQLDKRGPLISQALCPLLFYLDCIVQPLLDVLGLNAGDSVSLAILQPLRYRPYLCFPHGCIVNIERLHINWYWIPGRFHLCIESLPFNRLCIHGLVAGLMRTVLGVSVSTLEVAPCLFEISLIEFEFDILCHTSGALSLVFS